MLVCDLYIVLWYRGVGWGRWVEGQSPHAKVHAIIVIQQIFPVTPWVHDFPVEGGGAWGGGGGAAVSLQQVAGCGYDRCGTCCSDQVEADGELHSGFAAVMKLCLALEDLQELSHPVTQAIDDNTDHN